MAASPEYVLSISLNVLNHLGINLYSNVPAVLSEIIANSWDADADRVEITISQTEGEIVIQDTGVGMTKEDLNNRYLHVGYDKRNDVSNPLATLTPRGRRPMGRKGIGKLSVFSIAKYVEVHTVKDGQRSGLVMRLDDIKEAISGQEAGGKYYPDPVPEEDIAIDRGTRIILRDLKKRVDQAASHLRKRVARRFTVVGGEAFQVLLDGQPISARDRDYLDKIEFIWYLGDESREDADRATRATHKKRLNNVVDADSGICVTGWVGSVERPNVIEDQDNTIVLLARGKLIQEDVLSTFKEAGVYADYLIGEINADFLDSDDADDIITSDRQRINEDDPRYKMLRAYIQREILRPIKNEWSELRKSKGVERARENPILAAWLDELRGDNRRHAEAMFGHIETLKVQDEETKLELYKASIVGFERLALRHALSELSAFGPDVDVEALLRLFGNVDDLEAAHYLQIARGRLDVLNQFVDLVPDARERVVQQYLFDHLWLLDASWERAHTNARMEESVTAEFKKVTDRLTDAERRGRLDIRYRTVAGKHVIIELKKYDRVVGTIEILDQVRKYRKALRKCLDQFGERDALIEEVVILGERPEGFGEEDQQMFDAISARILTYDELIRNTQEAYGEYIEAQSKFVRIAELVDSLVTMPHEGDEARDESSEGVVSVATSA